MLFASLDLLATPTLLLPELAFLHSIFPISERVKVLVRVRPCLRDEENPGALTFSARMDGSSKMTLFRP